MQYLKRIKSAFYKALNYKSNRFASGVIIEKPIQIEGHNFFDQDAYFSRGSIGFASYIGSTSKIVSTSIGRYTSIGPNVNIVIGTHPASTFVSTHPAFFSLAKQSGFTYVDNQLFREFKKVEGTDYAVVIGNDVWIGEGVHILQGVTIEDGAIIGCGSVVTKDVKAYSIVAGVPASVLRYRFKEEEIDFLLKLKWWDKTEEFIKENIALFENIELLKENIKV